MDEDISILSNSGYIAIIVVILVIAVIGIAVWWSMSKNSPPISSSIPGSMSTTVPHNQSHPSQFPQAPTVNWSTLSDTQKSEVARITATQLVNMGVTVPSQQPRPTVVVVNSQAPPAPLQEAGRYCSHHACPIERCGCRIESHPRDRCPNRGTGCNNCVPIPAGALKATNEDYWEAKYYATPGLGLPSFGGIASLGCNCGCNAPRPCRNYKRLPALKGPTSDNYFTPFGPNSNLSNVPFISSVNAYSPYPAVESCWEKIGILTSSLSSSDPNSERNILNLYRRPIAPVQNLWAYQVQDAAGFVIPLPDREIRNGDTVTVPGKQGVWTAKTFNKDKYIWQC